MRYLSILTFLFSIAVINPAHAGIVVDSNGIVQAFTPDSDPDSLGTLYFYAGSYDSLIADGTPAHTFTGANGTGYDMEFYGELLSAAATLDIAAAYYFDRGDRPGGSEPLRSADRFYHVVVPNIYTGWEYNLDDAVLNSETSSGGRIVYWASTIAPSTSPTVPEPSTAVAMGLLGVLGFAGNRRRRLGVAKA